MVLHRGHPAEDAYILFRYVENFVAGFGIVYYPGGPRTEGATDFLWFLGLSGLVKLGLDVAVAAALLNAIGAGLAVHLLQSASERMGRALVTMLITLAVAAALLTSGGAIAGYSGFSAMLYSALAVSLFALLLETSSERVVWLPLIGLVVALFRPEGVVLGVISTIVAAVRLRLQPTVLWRFLFAAAIAAAIGTAYFVWRWWYFRHLLPLPLYVKSHGPMLAGVPKTRDWIGSAGGPVPLVLGLVAVGMLQTVPRAMMLRGVVALIPSIALVITLCFGNQLQNVGCRFQAPVIMALLLLLVHFAASAYHEGSTRLRRLLAPAILIASLVPSVWFWGSRTVRLLENPHRTYMDTFAPQLASQLDRSDVVALTEAGRLGFWATGRVEDIVGLNNPETAIRPPTIHYLRNLNPDVVMFHTAATLHDQMLPSPESPAVVEIGADLFARAVKAEYRDVFLHGLQSYDNTRLAAPVVAALALERFLSETPGYKILNVRYGNSRGHIYGFRERLDRLDAVIAELRQTCECVEDRDCTEYRSYASLRKLW